MGNPFLLQACLRLDESLISNPLEFGKDYSFSKEGHRLYQIMVPMDLRTSNWNFIARIVVTQITVGHGKTTGTFRLVKEFPEKEREVITKTFVSDEEVKEVFGN